jgi:hypothetical protein
MGHVYGGQTFTHTHHAFTCDIRLYSLLYRMTRIKWNPNFEKCIEILQIVFTLQKSSVATLFITRDVTKLKKTNTIQGVTLHRVVKNFQHRLLKNVTVGNEIFKRLFDKRDCSLLPVCFICTGSHVYFHR